jgi:hypothetical protein
LERYTQTCRDNELDLDVLRELAESDLEKLGIPLGHRKKRLGAIARWPVPLAAPPPASRFSWRQNDAS